MERKNNKGYSLVEVIVVITIMLIVTVGAGILVISWRSWYIHDCAKKLDTALSAAKVDCMSKENGKLTIYRDDEDMYYMEVLGEDPEKLGDDRIEIYYSDTAGNTDVMIDGTDTLVISYNRGTGAFKEIGTNAAGDKKYCTEIKIVRAGREVKFQLVKTTGNHYIEE